MNKKVKNILLWISVLPASLASMILAFGLWRIIHNLTASGYIDTNSWLNILFVEIMSNLIASAAFVLVGSEIAPNNKKIVAVVLTTLLILVSGSSLFIINFITKEYFTNLGIIAGIVGAIVCCISIYEGEFDKNE